MYQVSLKSEGVRPFFVITWPGITLSGQNVMYVAWSCVYVSRIVCWYCVLNTFNNETVEPHTSEWG